MQIDRRTQSIHAPGLDGRDALSLREGIDQFRIRLGGRFKLGLHAEFTRYGMCRDLALPFTNLNAKIPIAVRPLQDADFGSLFSLQGCSDPTEALQVARQKAFVAKGPRAGFVAVDQRSGTPCHVQWLFGPVDNEFLKRVGGFPLLQPQQALLENVFTPLKYRGWGIMSAAMGLIAERAADIGAQEVLAFVDQNNIASLKGCQRAGFYPYLLHHRTRMAFGLTSRDRLARLPADDPRRTQRF